MTGPRSPSAPIHTVNGAYLHRFSRRERLVAAQGRDAQLGRRLWEHSAELTGLPG